MISAIEYISTPYGLERRLRADKAVHIKNAWHLRTISGNGLPDTSAVGGTSYGIAGSSYGGVSVSERDINIELYADGLNAAGVQRMLADGARVATVGDDALGTLRLTNSAGEVYRIAAKCVGYDVSKVYRRTAEVDMSFACPYTWFESDVLQRSPIIAVEGGKEYPQGSGLERPYTFGDLVDATGGAKEYALSIFNAGDVPAPCVFRIYGTGITAVEVSNAETGAEIIASDLPSVGGIVIDTDENSASASFADGTDASPYISLASYISDFRLMPGANAITVKVTADSLTAAGSAIEWRGRYAACL